MADHCIHESDIAKLTEKVTQLESRTDKQDKLFEKIDDKLEKMSNSFSGLQGRLLIIGLVSMVIVTAVVNVFARSLWPQ